MSIGITAEHVELAEVVGRFVEAQVPPTVVRHTVDARVEARPEFWNPLCDLGWTGLHVPEAHGGSGYGAVELAVVLEALGRGCVPGPFLPTVLAAAVLTEAATGEAAKALLPQLATG